MKQDRPRVNGEAATPAIERLALGPSVPLGAGGPAATS